MAYPIHPHRDSKGNRNAIKIINFNIFVFPHLERSTGNFSSVFNAYGTKGKAIPVPGCESP
jgi:hypothetical protein